MDVRFVGLICLWLGAASASAAPSAHSAETLTQLVSDELLRDGVSLAKLGRALVVEAAGPGRWRLVVRDVASGRVVARKEVSGVPAELEAAAAQLVIAARPLVAAADAPDPWRVTFSPGALASRLVGQDLKLTVVAAGERLEEARAAAVALESALRGASRCRLVLDGAGLGGAALDDAAVLEKAVRLPIDQALVVRAFEDAESVSAVVTMYDRAGEVVGAFTAVRGEPLARGTAGDGPSAASTEAVPPVPAEGRERKKSEEEYELRAVGFKDFAGVAGTRGGAVVLRWTEPFKGKYHEPLGGAEFYTYVGRNDLAERYLERDKRRKGLMATGGVVAGGGVVLALSSVLGSQPEDCDVSDPAFEDCVDRNVDEAEGGVTRVGVGMGIAAAGALVAVIAAIAIKPHPVTAAEARQLGDEYNQRLRRELGLDEDGAAAPAPEGTPVSFAAAPWVARGGGGLALQLRF